MTTSDINWPQTHQSNLFYHSPEPPPTPGTSHLFHNDFLALPISEPSYMYHPPDFHVDSITTFRSLLKCHFFKNSSLTIICKATKTYKSLVTSCPFCVCVCVCGTFHYSCSFEFTCVADISIYSCLHHPSSPFF